MNNSHIKMLHETGSELLSKATTLSKVSDIEKCINLGTKLLAEARSIMDEQKLNSILIFAEFISATRAPANYIIYVEFCARNNLKPYCEEDYLNYIKPAENAVLGSE